MNAKQIEGRIGEDEATKYLQRLGYKIICNNFRCIQGEIDIIAQDDDELVFIEVKTRSTKLYGEARDAVDGRKQKHIYEAARYYLYKYRLEGVFTRVDVIEVYMRKCGFSINHLKQVL